MSGPSRNFAPYLPSDPPTVTVVHRGGRESLEDWGLRSDISKALGRLEDVGGLIDPPALFQLSWYIDAVNGSDDNDGAASDRALKTFAEYLRRTGEMVMPATGIVNIYLESDITENVTLRGHYINGLIITGTRTVIGTGTIAAVQQWDAATSADGQITDNGLPVSWTASGFVGEMIVLKTGANAGAWAWIGADLGAKVARHSPFTDGFATVHPAPTDTYEIVTLTQIVGKTTVSISGAPSFVLIQDVDFVTDVGNADPSLYVVNSSLSLSACKVSGSGYALVAGGLIWFCRGCGLLATAAAAFTAFSGSKLELHQTLIGAAMVCSRAGIIKVDDCLNQHGFGPATIGIHPYGLYGGVQVYGFFAAYDQPGAASSTIELTEFSNLLLIGKVFGTGNAGFGLWVSGCSQATYPAGANFTAHYDLTTGGTEVRYGGTDTTYAGVGVPGVFNMANGAKIVPSE